MSLPYTVSSNGTVTMSRKNMKKMSDQFLMTMFGMASTSAMYSGAGRLSKSTDKSLHLELKSRGLI